MHPRLVIILLLTAISCAHADEIWTGTSDVKFRGYSTLHNFNGTVNNVPLKVTVADGPNGRVVSATSNVEVKRMSTDHEKRDYNMWTMFQQAKYRALEVAVNGAEERRLHPPGSQPGSMPVMLTIAGTRGTVNAAVTNVKESPTQGSFDLAFPVSLKAFNLAPPSSLGGLVSVKDTVDVTVHVELKKAGVK